MPRKRKTPGNYQRRGSSIRVTLTFEGRRVRFTVPTTDLNAARIAGSERYAQLVADRERALAGGRNGVLMSQLLAEFARVELPMLAAGTIRAYENSLKPIRLFFTREMADTDVRRIGALNIKSYLAWRKNHRLDGSAVPVTNRTVEKDRAVLHRLFAFAEVSEYREGNPVRLTKRPRADKHDAIILSDEQYERLLTEASYDPMLHLFVLVLGETGMRCESEALYLRWSDVSFHERSITIKSGRDGHRTKSGKTRRVPITARLMSVLREHFAQYRLGMYDGERTDFVIHHERTRRHHLAGKRIRSLRNSFKRAAARAGLPREFRQHDLRHRRVTTWLGEGKPPVAVQMAMGHSDLRTTMGYYKLLPEHLRLLAEDIGRGPTPLSSSVLAVAG